MSIRRTAVSITLFATLFALVGCGVEGERLVALASFKQIETEPRGSVFMEMVRAYYQSTSPYDNILLNNNHSHPTTNTSSPTSSTPPPLPEPNIKRFTEEQHEAVIALLHIQSVDLSRPVLSDRAIQSMETSDLWRLLTLHSRSAFLSVYASTTSSRTVSNH